MVYIMNRHTENVALDTLKCLYIFTNNHVCCQTLSKMASNVRISTDMKGANDRLNNINSMYPNYFQMNIKNLK